MEPTFQPAFAQQQRLRFMESMLLWEGSVQRKKICNVFQVAPNHVTKDIRDYQQQFPKSLEYNPRARAYEPGAKFRPHFASEDPAEYLSLLLAYSANYSLAVQSMLGGIVPVESMPGVTHSVDADILKIVVQSIHRRTGISVTYHSMRSDKPGSRMLWPHALIHTGRHWHLRAFDSRTHEFRSFALTRIGKATAASETSPVEKEQDDDWNRKEILEIVPNPKLNKHQQEIVAKEYGMVESKDGWVWSVSVRRCLIPYFAALYQLDLADKNPLRNRMVFKDRKTVEKFLISE